MIQDEIGDEGFLRRNEHEKGEPAKIIALEGSNGDKTHLRLLCHGVEHDVPYHQWIPKKAGMYVINSKDNVSKLVEIKNYDGTAKNYPGPQNSDNSVNADRR